MRCPVPCKETRCAVGERIRSLQSGTFEECIYMNSDTEASEDGLGMEQEDDMDVHAYM